jgi:hypothetical protein
LKDLFAKFFRFLQNKQKRPGKRCQNMDKELEKPANSPQHRGTQRQRIEGRAAPEAQQHKQPELAQPYAVAQKQQ